ncbi:MAG: hypothetical protein QOC80_1390 [Frankiaceae bacterium]|nr:hypothetical protein [Frankiaceae bacterium]
MKAMTATGQAERAESAVDQPARRRNSPADPRAFVERPLVGGDHALIGRGLDDGRQGDVHDLALLAHLLEDLKLIMWR